MSNREIVVRLRAETAAYEAGMLRASAATKGVATSATAAAKTATAANTGLGKSAAATAVGMKAASNGMSGVASAARGTSGSISALGSGMAVASASAGRLGSGMKAAASNTAGVNSAVRGASGSITALGSGMAVAGSAATRASGGLKGMGGAASVAGAGALQASGGLKQVGGAASAAAAGAASAKGSLDGVGSAAKGASSNATAAATGFGQLSGSIRENRDAWGDLSTKAMIGGAAIVGGLGLATKAAISWESAWAGVQKTTDGSAAQMAKLEGELRQLATTLPASHQEIAAVAEAAGQLGIKRENVASFTKTMIDMGESTNMSAEEAATSIARFSNVMGTAQTDVDKIGSAVVGLGNNFATTESEIMAMSSRLSGAGRQANMTEGDVIGIATAMSSVGIEAEAGGTAMSRVIIEMGKSVDTGSEKLETFAKVAGMSTEAFAGLWRENSGEAMQRFIAGLGAMQARGESLEPTLAALGMTDIRVGDALRRSASAADLFGNAMQQGNAEFSKGTALADEASKRYATTESRMKIAMNSMKNAAIDLGSVIGPALAKVAEGAAGLANAFVQLPGPAKAAVTGIAGISGATLLVGGATVKAISGLQSFRSTLDTVGMLTPRVERGMAGAQKAVVGFGKALMGLAVIGTGLTILQDDLAEIGSQQLARDLNSSGDAIGVINSHIKEANAGTSHVSNLGHALKVSFDPNWIDKTGSALDGMLSVFGREKDGEIAQATKRLAELDSTLAQMVSGGDAAGAQRMFQAITDEAKKQGISVEELKKKFPQYAEALAGAENAGAGLEEGMSGIEDGAADAASQVEGLADEIKGLGDTLLGQRGSARDYQESLAELKSAIAENGANLDISTEAGRKNGEALDALAESTKDYAAATLESTGSVDRAQGVLDRGRKQWEKYALAAGMPRSEVKALADELFTLPEEATSDVNVKGAEQAKAKVLSVGTTIKGLDGKTVKIDEDGADVTKTKVTHVKGAVLGLPEKKSVKVTEIGTTAAGEKVVRFRGQIYSIPKQRTATVKQAGAAEASNKITGLIKSIYGVPKSKSTKISESGAAPSARRITDMSTKIRNLKGKKVTVFEAGASMSRGRVMKLDGAIVGLKGKTVNVREIGSTPSGNRVVQFKNRIYEVPDSRTSNVRANVHGLWDVDALRNSINATNSKTVTINTVLNTIRRTVSSKNADGGIHENVGGGLVQSFADGGFVGRIGSQQPQIRAAGGKGILWAEDGAGPWESFISGHPAKAARSKQIWMETGRRLGMIEAHADGAVRQYAQPAPPVRQHVPPPQRVMAQAPAAPVPAGGGVSTLEMERAISRAFADVRITTRIGSRDFQAAIDRTARDRRGR